ncbi:sensor histidine kinase [Enterococcus casseliflavus]|uniref:sensor histidine kinase n=1 Tax=Enterococcus casseliflavus TaxID=37734 RepID=UPI0017826D90|nr:sensor histidine kinase [Enterococcus casseliflavus]QOG29397.1 sensor histidine kinase [Enterococcus casseliflavus]
MMEGFQKAGITMQNIKNVKSRALAMEFPVIGGILLVYTATVFFQSAQNWNIKSIVSFSLLITLHAVMYLYREQLFKEKIGFYLFLQGIIIFSLSIVIKENYQAAYLGLIPMIIAQSIQLCRNVQKTLFSIVYFYLIYCIPIIATDGYTELLHSISLLVLISFSIVVYGYLYSNQVRAFEKTQRLLVEIETANEKIEELARESERQKLARDIHDTLLQGMAGVLLKMEALDIHLENGNVEKSQQIAQKIANQTRDSLKESREIINGLRLHDEIKRDLGLAIDKEIEIFRQQTAIDINVNKTGYHYGTVVTEKNIAYIIREILMNINKHAKATKVNIIAVLEVDRIIIRVEDNGVGFDYKHFHRIYGHYGIIGMQERAKVINGQLNIESEKQYGTCITLTVKI